MSTTYPTTPTSENNALNLAMYLGDYLENNEIEISDLEAKYNLGIENDVLGDETVTLTGTPSNILKFISEVYFTK